MLQAVAWRRPSEQLLRPGEAACGRLPTAGGRQAVCLHRRCTPAFARVKVQWAKLDAVKLIKEGTLEGKEHRHPEMYYEGVLQGARLIANECSKDVIFE